MVVSAAIADNVSAAARRSAGPSRRSPRLWRDLIALAGGQMASKLLGFLAFAYLARTLSPAGYGAVEYAAGLAFIAAMFVDAGLSPIGVRRIARDPGSAEEVSAEVLGVRFVLALVMAGLLAASPLVTAPDPLTARLVALFAASLVAVPWSQMWLFQAVDRIAWTAGVQTVRMAAFLVVVLLLVRDRHAAVWVGLAELVGLALSGACALVLQSRHVAAVRLRFGVRRVVRLLTEGLPLALSNLVTVVTEYAPLLLAVNLLGTGAAAAFAGAHRLYFALTTLSWIYHFNLFPVIVRAESRAPERLRPLVESSFRLVAWAGTAAALALTLLAGPLLTAAFGASFALAATAFSLLAWALPVKLLAEHAASLLIASGAERAVFAARTGGLVVALAAGLPLVRSTGAAGGAAAMLAGSVVCWAGLHVLARQRFGWAPWRPALGALTCGVALLWTAQALELATLPATGWVALAYAAVSLPFAGRLRDDFRRLAEAKAGRIVPAAGA